MNKMTSFYTTQFIITFYTYTFGPLYRFFVVLFTVGAGVVRPVV